ncbi:MAG: hypothetical protein ACAI38_16755 [Myxococcota bacterium]|nr:hypothetical protein [Myxococcota bacterium]
MSGATANATSQCFGLQASAVASGTVPAQADMAQLLRGALRDHKTAAADFARLTRGVAGFIDDDFTTSFAKNYTHREVWADSFDRIAQGSAALLSVGAGLATGGWQGVSLAIVFVLVPASIALLGVRAATGAVLRAVGEMRIQRANHTRIKSHDLKSMLDRMAAADGTDKARLCHILERWRARCEAKGALTQESRAVLDAAIARCQSEALPRLGRDVQLIASLISSPMGMWDIDALWTALRRVPVPARQDLAEAIRGHIHRQRPNVRIEITRGLDEVVSNQRVPAASRDSSFRDVYGFGAPG